MTRRVSLLFQNMNTTRVELSDSQERPIPETKVLIWGNNAAWICPGCGTLLGNRTGDAEFRVSCPVCHAAYEILRGPSKSGKLHLGPARGVKKL